MRNVLFSAVTAGHDAAFLPGNGDAFAQRVLFSDRPIVTSWDVRVQSLPFASTNPRLAARWVKTNAKVLFPNHDYAVWVDGNITAVESLSDYLTDFRVSNRPIGLFKHFARDNPLDEAQAVIRHRLDDAGSVARFLASSVSCPVRGLYETNVVFFALRHPQLDDVLKHWWQSIAHGTIRDQVSLPFVLSKLGVEPFVFPSAYGVRSDAHFGYAEHSAAWLRPLVVDLLAEGALEQKHPTIWSIDPSVAPRAGSRSAIEYVVPVRNSVDVAIHAINYLYETSNVAFERIIVVDDASDPDESVALRASLPPGVTYLHNPSRLGYGGSCNRGFGAGVADTVFFVNSDAFFNASNSSAVLNAFDAVPPLAAVGFMSNAGGAQTVPVSEAFVNWDAGDAPSLEAGCLLPKGLLLCPAINGFCFAVRRKAISRDLGLFDNFRFRTGYGEETDLMLRLYRAGWLSGVLLNVFVPHLKTKSFAIEEREQLVAEGLNANLTEHGAALMHEAGFALTGHHVIRDLQNSGKS